MLHSLLRSCVFLLLALLLPVVLSPARAAPPLPGYTHTAWRAADGAPLDIRSMAQTEDGTLWLGTPNGLYRFDGIEFSRVKVPRMRRMPTRIDVLVARPGGELWIADDARGMFVLRGGVVKDITPELPGEGVGFALAFAFDADGSAWVASSTGLWHFAQGRWRRIEAQRTVDADGTPHHLDGAGLSNEGTSTVLVDQYGRVWWSRRDGIYLLDRAAQRLRRVVRTTSLMRLAQSPDGRLWALPEEPGHGQPVASPVPAPVPTPALPAARDANHVESRARGQFDRDGNLWLAGCPAGVCLAAGAGALDGAVMPTPGGQPPQLAPFAATNVNCLLEDRSGNLWFGTRDGLDRLHADKVTRVPIDSGKNSYTMARDTEGDVWVAESIERRVWKIRKDGSVQEDRSRPITVVANDRDGALLLGGRNAIFRRSHGVETRIDLPPTPDGRHVPLSLFGLLDDGKALFIGASEIGVVGLEDGTWHYRDHWRFPRNLYTSAPGGKGRIWLATLDGTVVLWERARTATYGAGMIGRLVTVIDGPDVLATGEEGIAVLQRGRFRMLRAAVPAVLRNVSGLGISPDGDRWLNGARGIVRVAAADWRAAMADPAVPLRYTLIDSYDGYPGQAMLESRLHSVYTHPDGRMWFMTSSGIVQLDPRRLERDTLRPVVSISAVHAAGQIHGGARVRLPSGTQDFSIAYGAPSLSRADGVHFQYMLEGRDPGWQDGGLRRTAWYTNIAPGRYTFRVRAINEDGVASAADAATVIVIEPTVTQSLAFRTALVACAALALYGLYHYSLSVETRRIAERHDARLAERERIARTLHDTFLQSVQGLVLRVHAAAKKLPPGDAVRKQLETVLDQADGTLAEGRNQVHELRSGRDAERVLEEAGKTLAATFPDTAFRMTVTGARVPMRAQVQDEIAEIGAEALRNAFFHARATLVELVLDYGRGGLALRVTDDGVGFDESLVRKRVKGKHWGLVGMRERAMRVNGRLDIGRMRSRGTRVELQVAARIAYLVDAEAAWG
ncbi:two-component regulator propeller domain-containing protein [Massilia sp. TN1-12]|uniref:sensor histidine kinase n=1 Tax=Massilia paldalensis TaxID=3377675 RepID=UPI00384D2B4F